MFNGSATSSFGKVLGSIGVGNGPTALACDSSYLYVVDLFSNDLEVVNLTSDAVVATFGTGGFDPDAVAVDWVSGQVLVANDLSNDVSVFDISASNITASHLDRTIAVGSEPRALNLSSHLAGSDYPPYVFVANYGSDNVTVLNASTLSPVASVPVGRAPDALGFSYFMHRPVVLVANKLDGTLTGFNATTLASPTTGKIGFFPDAIETVPFTDRLIVADGGSGLIWDTDVGLYFSSNGTDPVAIAYDQGVVLVANFVTGNVVAYEPVGSGNVPLDASLGLGLVLGGVLQNIAQGQSSPSLASLLLLEPTENKVVEVNQSSDHFVREVRVGSAPAAAAFDPADGDVFVANQGSDNITVFNATTDAFVASIAVGRGPSAIAFDPLNDYMYVANELSGNLTVLNGSGSTVGAGSGVPFHVGDVPVGSYPDAVAVDPANGCVYVANLASDNLSVLVGSTAFSAAGPGSGLDLGSIPVGSGPSALGFDAQNRVLYVANEFSENVTLVNGSGAFVGGFAGSGSLDLASVPVGNAPVSIALDTAHGRVYVANSLSDNLSVLSTSTNFSGPGGGSGLDLGSVPVGADPSAVSYVPALGEALVSNLASGTISFVAASFNVTFVESGLPVGTQWSASIAGTTANSTSGSVAVGLPNGSYAYAIGIVPDVGNGSFSPTPSSGTAVVNGTSVTVDVTFSKIATVRVTFREHALPVGAAWTVQVPNAVLTNTTVAWETSSAGAISLGIPLGTVEFSAPNVTLGGATYGLAKVSGCPSCQPGGDPGTIRANLTGSTVIGLTFGPLQTFYFNESGLSKFEPYHWASWNVSLYPVRPSGASPLLTESTFGTSIAFVAPAGAVFRFMVTGPSPEYRISPARGLVHVSAGSIPTVKVVKFVLLTSKIVFAESGLPAGTNWTVDITNSSTPAIYYFFEHSSGGHRLIVFHLPAGTYTWVVAAPGYNASLSSGTLVVVYPSAATVVNLTFSPSAAGCFFFTHDGAALGGPVCNANANDILLNFTQSPSADVCANQFTLGAANDGPKSPCPSSSAGLANQLEVNWTGSAAGPIVSSCYWALGGTPIGSCVVPSPAPNGFEFGLAIVTSVSWTVNGAVVGPPVSAPAGSNGVVFST